MQPHSSFLPTDDQIYERSKNLAKFFSRIVSEEDYQEFKYDDINNMFNDDDDERDDEDSEAGANEENTPSNGCGALVKVEKFEASSNSSDDFDDENLLNETRHIIEERKRQWRESGMDRVLDTFDFNAITDKVGSWLRKTKQDRQLPSDVSMHEVHYENHQYELNSDDSFQSADTAKYILSNRKPRAGSCTKMIIKRFRYVKGKRKELQKKYNCLETDLELDKIFNKRAPCTPKHLPLPDLDEYRTPTKHNGHYDNQRHVRGRNIENESEKYRRCCDISGMMPLNANYKTPKTNCKADLKSMCKTTALTYEANRKNRSRFRKRRSDVGRKRSTSRSSSYDSDRITSHARPRFRKLSRKGKKPEIIDLSMLSSHTSDDSEPNKIRARTPPQKAQSSGNNDIKKGLNPDVTCFLPENIVNSTAIPSEKGAVPLEAKSCQLSPVKTRMAKENALEKIKASSYFTCSLKKGLSNKINKTGQQVAPPTRKDSLDSKSSVDSNISSDSKNSTESKNANSKSSADSKTSDKRIVLYDPDNEALYNESIDNGCFILTEEYLKRSVGRKQAQRFITFNERKFPLKFDLSSTVYFMLPAESENSHRSGSSGESDDEDVLNMFGKQGTLIEHTSLN